MNPLLKCICIFKSNMHLFKYPKQGIYHDSSKCIYAFDFVFSERPKGAVSYQKGVYKQTHIDRRRALYRFALKTIYNLVRSIGLGSPVACLVRGSKLKSNAYMHLPELV